jgi:hypothetical protein
MIKKNTMLIENRGTFKQIVRRNKTTTIIRNRRKGKLCEKNGKTLTIELISGIIITDNAKFWGSL